MHTAPFTEILSVDESGTGGKSIYGSNKFADEVNNAIFFGAGLLEL
jgi:hypothetical protein